MIRSWDGIGTLAIGLLLGVIAITLAVEMKSLLIGEGALPEQRERMLAAVAAVARCRAAHPHAHRLPGTRRDAGRSEGAVRGDGLTTAELADAIDRTEAAIREAEPIARVIYLEPDLYDPDRVDSPADADDPDDADVADDHDEPEPAAAAEDTGGDGDENDASAR